MQGLCLLTLWRPWFDLESWAFVCMWAQSNFRYSAKSGSNSTIEAKSSSQVARLVTAVHRKVYTTASHWQTMLGQSSNYAFDYATIMPRNMLNYAELCSVPLCIHAVHRGLRNHAYTHAAPGLSDKAVLCPIKHNVCLNRKIMPTLNVGIRIIIMPEHNFLTKLYYALSIIFVYSPFRKK